MDIRILDTSKELGAAAAAAGAAAIRSALAARGQATIILATGASQIAMLDTLVQAPDLAWDRVTAFHLDEYIGLPASHRASFRRYLRERVATRVPKLLAFHYVDGDAADPAAETRRLGALIAVHAVDVAFIGVGENGHLAFNDPPADFDTNKPYLIVNLDEACRRQQMGEGWFATLEDVPRRAISMSVRRILASRKLVVKVPDRRKAEAVRNAVEGPVTNLVPASILRTHADCTLFLDREAASSLSPTAVWPQA
ncbi:MAG: glucosamine-6-phosphate deaminase [Burkholderiales bacterium]|nr:glucosamine-6-phosphate deaminase [Burkholderiales bacterium]